MNNRYVLQTLLGIVSTTAIIMIIIVYFFGDSNVKVVEKVVEKEVIVYRDAPAAPAPAQTYTVDAELTAPIQQPPIEYPVAQATSAVDEQDTLDEIVQTIVQNTEFEDVEGVTLFSNYDASTRTVYIDMHRDPDPNNQNFRENVMKIDQLKSDWEYLREYINDTSYKILREYETNGLYGVNISFRCIDADGTLLLESINGVTAYDYFG